MTASRERPAFVATVVKNVHCAVLQNKETCLMQTFMCDDEEEEKY
jgi:hypothetical protein